MEGQLLAGKYRVERLLGQGGMGVVLAARHIHLEERVAVKLMLAEAAFSSEAVARFLREARAAARLESAHVARVSDVGTLEDGRPYMVMEYLDGSDLAQLLAASGPLAMGDAIDYVLQAAEAIAEAALDWHRASRSQALESVPHTPPRSHASRQSPGFWHF